MKRVHIFLIVVCGLIISAQAQTYSTLGTDEASNYNDWNGDPSLNEGSGFNAWTFIDNGGERFLGTTAVGTTSFGLRSDGPGISYFASRTFANPLQPGDRFRVNLGHTATINGTIGIQFRDGNSTVWTLKLENGGTFWEINDGDTDVNTTQNATPNTTLTLEFIYEGNSQYSYTFGSASGNTIDFADPVTNIDGVRFFSFDQGLGENFGFDALSIERPDYTTIASGTYSDPSTWFNGDVPNSTGRVTIAHDLTITSDIVHSGAFTINTGNVLTIAPGHSLTFTGSTFTNNGTVDMASSSTTFSSFIPLQTSTLNGTGSYIYSKFTNANGNGNDLISPPVSGDSFGPFASRNTTALVSNPGNPNEKVFGPFMTSAATPSYENYIVGTDDAEILSSGSGYRAATNSGSNLDFSGSVLKDNLIVPIVNNGETGFRSWNLVGNPFSAYLNLEALIQHPSSLSSIDPAFLSFYVYNAGTGNSSFPGATTNGNWTIVSRIFLLNAANENTAAAPGQGFFVKANTGGGSLVFEESTRQSATASLSSDDGIFGRLSDTATNFAVAKIALTSNEDLSEIDVYFLDDATMGLDPGYDVGGFGGSGLGIYTYLLEGNTGVEMAIQALPYSSISNISIPLGITMNEGTEFTLALNSVFTNLPEGINVYLEDTVNNSSTLLNTSDYTLTPSTDLSGTDRFILRFEANSLSAQANALSHITVSSTAEKEILISGILYNITTANIYDLQGRLVHSLDLKPNVKHQRIDGQSLNQGVYIVELNTGNTRGAHKMILR